MRPKLRRPRAKNVSLFPMPSALPPTTPRLFVTVRSLSWATAHSVSPSKIMSSSKFGPSATSAPTADMQVAADSGRTCTPRYTARSLRHLSPGLHECSYAGDVAAHDERLHSVGPLVGVNDFHVCEVARDVVLKQDPVASHYVACLGADLLGLPRVVHLREGGHRARHLALFLELGEPKADDL